MSKQLILITALLAATLTHAQQLLEVPTNKSRVIVIVLDSVAPADAYKMAAAVFMDAGYALAKTDETLFYLSTDWGEGQGFWLHQYAFMANVRPSGSGSQVRLTGQFRLKNHTPDQKATLGGEYNVNEIEKRSNMGKYWKDMEALASQIGGKLRYL
jgi:hypothetical protein